MSTVAIDVLLDFQIIELLEALEGSTDADNVTFSLVPTVSVAGRTVMPVTSTGITPPPEQISILSQRPRAVAKPPFSGTN